MTSNCVAEYLVDFLAKQEVSHVFGYQGSAVAKIIDCIDAHSSIDYIQCYHEQSAAFAASGYARTSGKTGVALATSGPGATNLLTGIADAYFDSIPTLFITGQVDTRFLAAAGKGRQQGFQGLDIVSMVTPIAKFAQTVLEPESFPHVLEKAWKIANSGRKGPVLLDIPLDIQFKTISKHQPIASLEIPLHVNSQEIPHALDLFLNAKHPVIVAGGGIRSAKAGALLDDFAKQTGVPLVTTLAGIDCSAYTTGFAGIYGSTTANLLLQSADYILVLGSRLATHFIGKRVDSYFTANIIRVDIDATEFDAELTDAFKIQVDIADFLKTALNYTKTVSRKRPNAEYSAWQNQMCDWNSQFADTTLVHGGGSNGIDPVLLCREIYACYPEDTIFCADVGSHQMWAAQAFYTSGKRRLLNSCGHGSMGFALPAAIGAHYATKTQRVAVFVGDGGLQMNIQELELLHTEQPDISIFVFNNAGLGMISSLQDSFYGSRYAGTRAPAFSCPNLEKVAELYGLRYLCIQSHADLEKLAQFSQAKTPSLINILIPKKCSARTRYDEATIFEKIKLKANGE